MMHRETHLPQVLVSHLLRFMLLDKMLLHRTKVVCLISGMTLISLVGLLDAHRLAAQTPDAGSQDAIAPVEATPIEASPIESAPMQPEPIPDDAAPFPIAPAAPTEPPASISPISGDSLSPTPGSSSPLDDAYIDSTNYSLGATERTIPTVLPPGLSTVQQLPSLPTSVQIGPVNVSSYGLGLGTTPSVRDFYRRTLRPPGKLGNGNIRLIFPLSIPAPITSLFGWREHPIFGETRFHSGTDIGAPLGTPVLAAYAGRVALADFLGGYGLAVAIDHNKGMEQTLYAHLSEIFVKSGDVVKQGAVIGRVGSTGNSTGPHLHLEFRQLTPDGWVALDPGGQLEYALSELVKAMDISEKGIAQVPNLQVSRQSLAGVSGKIAWNAQVGSEKNPIGNQLKERLVIKN